MALSVPSHETQQRTRAQSVDSLTKRWRPWQALRRKLDRKQPDYRN